MSDTPKPPSDPRILSIDIAKGICIVMVVFAHSELGKLFPGLNDALGLVRMPLFFFLSGIFFIETRRFSEVVGRRAEALLKPYFVTLLPLWFFDVLRGRPDLLGELVGIFYGVGPTVRWVPMWFLPHLWLVNVVAWLVMSTTHLSAWSPARQAGFLCLLCAVGALTVDWFWPLHVGLSGNDLVLPGLPLSLDLVLLTVTFFISGRLLRSRVKTFAPQLGLVLTAALVLVAIALSTDAAVRLNERLYEPPFLSTVAAFAGIYLILITARLMERIDTLRRPLCWLGSASIFILIFHYTIEARLYRLLTTQLPILPELLSATLAFAGSIALSLAIRAVIMRSEFLSMLYLPRGAVHFRNLRARLQPLRR